MRERLSTWGATLALLGIAALGVTACREPGSTRIVGPDGSPMAHVHCGADQGACFRIAGEACPSGYEMTPVLSGNDGNFLVRCRAAGAALAQAPAAPPAAAPPAAAPPAPIAAAPPAATPAKPSAPAATPAPAAADRWPPATEPWPNTSPWSPTTSNAGQRSGQEPDIGY